MDFRVGAVSAQATAAQPGLVLWGITKRFGSSVANNNVNLSVALGRVHALIGENGAGKTTLMNIAYGLLHADEGTVAIKGKIVHHNNPRNARELGLGMVHQHFALVPTMTVAENLALGGDARWLDRQKVAARVQEVAEMYGVKIDSTARVGDLPVALRQLVEILKMLYHDADVLILDEPTSVLSPLETRDLLRTLRRFSERGKAVVFVSHKLPEVLAIADQITVMRRGEIVGELAAEEATEDRLARLMVGVLPPKGRRTRARSRQRRVLQVNELTVRAIAGGSGLQAFSVDVNSNEIVGIAAVAGNGQRELVRAVVGLTRAESGRIALDGDEITRLSVGRRRRLRLAYMPEERLAEGVNVTASVEDNLILGLHQRKDLRGRLRLKRPATRRLAHELIEKYNIVAPSPETPAGALSGGNLQRLIAAREIALQPRLFIAEEPTSGLDIQATAFIRGQILRLREEGVGVLLVSSDLDELIELSDRIIVLYRGRVAGELAADQVSEERLGKLMVGAA